MMHFFDPTLLHLVLPLPFMGLSALLGGGGGGLGIDGKTDATSGASVGGITINAGSNTGISTKTILIAAAVALAGIITWSFFRGRKH